MHGLTFSVQKRNDIGMRPFIETRTISGVKYIDVHHSHTKPLIIKFNNPARNAFTIPDWYVQLPPDAMKRATDAVGPEAKVAVITQHFRGHHRHAIVAQATNAFRVQDLEFVG